MPANKKPRTTLADRRRLALAQLEEEDLDRTAAQRLPIDDTPRGDIATIARPFNEVSVDAPAEEAKTPPTVSRTRKTTAQIAREKGKVALGLYFPNAEDLDLARRAFVTDFWEHEGPDTFSEWLSQAVLTHAGRSHTQRAEIAQPRRTRQAGVRGKLRKIDVRREISEAVDAGITEDRRQLRRQITVSTWCNDAVMAAVHAAKHRTEGELMDIDGSLPPRLKK